MKDSKKLIDEAFEISEYIRYIAVYDNNGLITKQRNDIINVSASESDKYEELLVNPVLIKLASQRGNIDCGGLDYLIIRYGNFFVLLFPCRNGHANFGVEPDQDPFSFIKPLNTLLRKYNLN